MKYALTLALLLFFVVILYVSMKDAPKNENLTQPMVVPEGPSDVRNDGPGKG